MKKKKTKNIYDLPITMENLYKIWNIVRKTCKNKREVFYFSLNLNTNLMKIYKSLKNRTYKPSRYKTFMIFEPKARLVMSQTVTDKIVNHFIADFYLIPYLEPKLIDSNVATRKGKGGSYAMNLLKKYFNKLLINHPNQEIYCLKIDISKYFYSIDHKLLIEMLEKNIYDKDVINLIKLILSETNKEYINKEIDKYNEEYQTDIPHYKKDVGISIGAMSSQFLAIFFLSEIDHYIKEELKCSWYIRYMDDMIFLDTDKERLKYIYKCICEKIEELNLKVNKKSNIYRSSNGFSFLGYTYKVINNKLHISCKKETYIRINKKLKYLEENDSIQYRKSLGSYYGYLEKYSKIERVNLKVSSRELYFNYKKKYKDYIVIIKDKKYYKIFGEDAIIMWYLFRYSYNNGVIMFGNNAYSKVINRLQNLGVDFVIASKVDLLLEYLCNESNYFFYYNKAKMALDNYKKENYLVNKLRLIIRNNINNYDEIDNFLEEFEKKCKIP